MTLGSYGFDSRPRHCAASRVANAECGNASAWMFFFGLAAALLASALFNVGLALQALEARVQAPALGLRLSLLLRLLRRPLWLLGWLLGLVGIAPQVLAVATAPFVVVQPALASGLLLLLWIGSHRLDEPVGAREWIGVGGVVAGVALVAAGVPEHTETHRGEPWVLGVVAALSAVPLLPFAVRGTRFDSAWLVMVASGVGFGATNIATKLFSDDVGGGKYVAACGWAAVGLALGVAATVTGMTAFQRRRATVVVPVTTAVQTFVPIALEPLFLREQWTSAPTEAALIALGMAAAAVGTVLVARTRSVSTLAAGARST